MEVGETVGGASQLPAVVGVFLILPFPQNKRENQAQSTTQTISGKATISRVNERSTIEKRKPEEKQ